MVAQPVAAPVARPQRIVMVFSPKGGVGKTMISAHLLVSAARQGLRVVGVDFDPQRSLSIWYEGRAKNSNGDLIPLDIGGAALADWMNVFDHTADYDLIVIDMPPGFEGREAEVFAMAKRTHLILIPCGVAAGDLPVIAPWMDRFRERGLNAKFAVTLFHSYHELDYRQTERDLSAHGPIIGRVPRRVELSHAWRQGLTALEARAAQAVPTGTASEFTSLWNHVQHEVSL
jgi:chromosome partitioning protein